MTVIASRYEVVQQLGAGGMGVVYLVRDKLRGQHVALKQVLLPDDTQRLAITREFRTLSTLRHPNIVGVIEYGAHEGQPYLTMEYLPNAAPLDNTSENKIAHFIQMLQALGYLHRRGVLHRDLKPGNVLVTAEGVVKVLDFGLARNTGTTTHSASNMAGTFNYMAPELFNDEPPTVGSDLWAAGVMLCDLLSGHHPFDTATPMKLMLSVVSKLPDLSGLDPVFVPILLRLLSKNPSERYPNALEVIQDVRAAAGIESPTESRAHRESFLQAAAFVGREREYETLVEALNVAANGTSQLWFIGGEAGAGKSRLLDEVRTRALVDGFTVLQGQAVEGGGLPFQAWRDPARKLVLGASMDDLTASVLKELVPDIATLLERDVPDAPALDPAANLDRLMVALLTRLRSINTPILLLLEDIHWASESLDLLRLLLPRVSALPTLIIGAYRHDEMPTLPDAFSTAHTLLLERLSPESIAALSASMIGADNATPELVQRLSHESEGNALFMVEVMRALAEEAGSLGDIARLTLPERIFAGGMMTVLRRRLERVPLWALETLQLAAVIGRKIDLAVFDAAGVTDVDRWLHACADAAVLEPYQGDWRFSHDRLREALLDNLADDQFAHLHERAALALEAAYPDNDNYSESLVEHWRAAKNAEREAKFIIKAVGYLLSVTGDLERLEAMIERGLSLNLADTRAELLLMKGNIAVRRGRHTDALTLFQNALQANPFPLIQAETLRSISWELMYINQLDQAMAYALQAQAICEQVEDKKHMGMILAALAAIYGYQGDYTNQKIYLEKAIQLYQDLGLKDRIAGVLGNLGLTNHWLGDDEAARMYISEALQLFRLSGNRANIAWASGILGAVSAALGDYASAFGYFEASISLFRELQDPYNVAVYASSMANTYLWIGDQARAQTTLIESLRNAQFVQAAGRKVFPLSAAAWWVYGQGQVERAALMIGLFKKLVVPAFNEFESVRRLVARLRAELGDEAYEAALERGKSLDVHRVLDELLAELSG